MTRQEQEEIGNAIAQAQVGTTGRIAVRVLNEANVDDAFERAKQEFFEIGLQRHEHANGALILVAPKARRFAIIGDRALHEKVGAAFWDEVVKESQPFFARGDTQAGILYGIARIGEALRTHFAA